ncbi:MAG: ABC transporter substrate-binding protein [Hyphomicrobiales bacterium]|nr:ABC transporter substrate-binding protein [Hyphomicrobiales bacterium]
MSRRDVLAGAASVATLATLPRQASAAAEKWTSAHGMSVFGDLAMPEGFKSFPYVRIDAPKGGVFSQDTQGPFNSLNPFILSGDAPSSAAMIFDSLMTGSLDEPDAMYPLVASSVGFSPDKTAMRFPLRPEARFHDGSPLTAVDVVWSLNILKEKGRPSIRQNLRDMESASVDGDHAVVVKLKAGSSRQLPLFIAGLPIFSSKYYAKHKFDESTLDPPLGSAAYKIGKFEAGRFISFDRAPNYWAKDLPVNVGQNNFDTIRYEYFGDRSVAFEAFKAGVYAVREEFTSAIWATGYDFPAVTQKHVLRETLPDARISGIQGWFFNTRRDIFKDPRFREAIGCCFDFKWTNTNLMYGLYQRTQSYFENSPMEAKGPPDEKERALLEPFRGKVPDEVFGTPFLPPDSDGSGQDRALLKRAMDLFAAAGCKRDGSALMLPSGKPVQMEFLDFSSALERHTQPFIKNLKLLGVDATMRIVDPAQYQRRLEDFDFDIITQRLVMANSPGEELASMFGSEYANVRGGQNMIGVADPVVDALIAKAQTAETREDLVAICRALDRVLRAGRYWTPHWYKPNHWIAHWDLFGRPERTPRYDPGLAATWWQDPVRAKANMPAGMK